MTLFDLPEPKPDPTRFMEPAERQRTRKVRVREHERTVRMPDVDAPSTVAGSQPTSKAAAAKHLPKSGSKRRRIFEFVRAAGAHGATDDEIERALELPHQSASAGRNTLAADGWIEKSGRTRPTRYGNAAAVWVVSPDGRAAISAEISGTARTEQ